MTKGGSLPAPSAGGERCHLCDAPAHGVGDLRDVGGGLCVYLQHEKPPVSDEDGVRRAHRGQHIRRSGAPGVRRAGLEGVDDLLVTTLDRGDEQGNLGGEEFEDVGG